MANLGRLRDAVVVFLLASITLLFAVVAGMQAGRSKSRDAVFLLLAIAFFAVNLGQVRPAKEFFECERGVDIETWRGPKLGQLCIVAPFEHWWVLPTSYILAVLIEQGPLPPPKRDHTLTSTVKSAFAEDTAAR